MKSTVRRFLALALVASAFIASLSALAQTGSRLCGWTATDSKGQVVGFFYEARRDDKDFTKKCNTAIDETQVAYKKDPSLAALKWTKYMKIDCMSVGKQFKSKSNPHDDMCEYMEARNTYKVVKESADKTTYTKM